MKRLILLLICMAGLPPGLPAWAEQTASNQPAAASQPAGTEAPAADELAAAIQQAQAEAAESAVNKPPSGPSNKEITVGGQLQTLLSLFPRAVLAGVVIAAVCSLLGVFVILKRVVFIGIALSEVAACGIAAGMLFGLHPYIGAGVLTLAAVAVLAQPFETDRIPRDAILGVIFVLASSLSVLIVAKSGFGLEEVKALLYGDLILTSSGDLRIILWTLLPVLAYLLVTIRPTLYTFLDREAARLLGIRVNRWELAFFFALGLAVSAASKTAGALLVFCYLVVTPSAALLLSRRLLLVMVIAVLLAVGSTILGMYESLAHDLPTNQTVAVTACGCFVIVLLVRVGQWAASRARLRWRERGKNNGGVAGV